MVITGNVMEALFSLIVLAFQMHLILTLKQTRKGSVLVIFILSISMTSEMRKFQLL